MSKPKLEKRSFFFLSSWLVAGALFVSIAALGGRSVHWLPVTIDHLWFLTAVGGLAGCLLGCTQLRLRALHHRLEESQKHFRQFYQNTPAMLYSMDGVGHLLDVSQSWFDLFGYQRADVIGRDLFSFVVAQDPAKLRAEFFQLLSDFGEVRDFTCQLRLADGSIIDVALSAVAKKTCNGEMTEILAVLNDLTSHRVAEARIERLAYYDTLTGLPNRALMNDRIFQAMAQAKRDNRQVGIFFFDLDRFKLINDTQGHAVGDLVLRSVAERLKNFIREGDTFARLGGDEFVILQADPNHDPNFAMMGLRILETLGKPFQIDGREFFTTASIGVAIYPVDGEDAQTLLKKADTAMYVAKSRGRNNIQFFSAEMNAVALSKVDLESRLRKALQNNELQQYYQPQVNLLTGRISGVEALLRWFDSKGNLIPPGEIVGVAEECGLAIPLGEWVLKTACAQAREWQQTGMAAVRMSINLSGHHIRQANFIDRIEAILSETGIDADVLEIELSENSIMGHVDESIAALTDLKVRGINLTIDDFGTGYSSLLYLKHFPIHRIKIARGFIRDIIHNTDSAAITEAIIKMASSLKLSVTAVGVEDLMQLDFLRERGCLEVQGQLFGTAMNAEKMAHFLKDNAEGFPDILQLKRRTDRKSR